MQTMRVNGYDMAYLDVGRDTDNRPPWFSCTSPQSCDAVLGFLAA
jgi:hypothetical protein